LSFIPKKSCPITPPARHDTDEWNLPLLPEAAMEWSASLNNETLRLSELRKQFFDWSAVNATAAQRWLEESKLNEAEKAALRNAREG
jgi:hypothetical protein